MFSKSSNRSTPELPSRNLPVNSPSGLSIIAQGLEITGNLSTTGEVQLDGSVKGDIRCGAITVGESGVLVGSIVAERAVIRGTVQGTIQAKNVSLERSAVVTGDIAQENIAVDSGAQLDGRIVRKSDPHMGDLPIGGTVDIQPALKAIG
jgi:cytoskeletal protein CcmA (bactofilin family)